MLKDKLKQDVIVALKSRDEKRVGVLRYLVSLVDKRELQLPPGQMDEGAVLAVIQKELKNKEEARAIYQQAGRQDLVAEQDYEILVVKEYLPKEMSQEELEAVVDEVVAVVGSNFGAVMKEVMGKLKGRVGGEVISSLVKQRLGSNG